MSKFPQSSLRVRAIFLVLLAIIPLLALTLYSYFDRRDQAICEMQRDELVAVRNLATSQETVISNARNLLTTLSRIPEVQSLDREACNALFAELLKQSPFCATIGATDSEGRLFASAPVAPGPVTYGDRPWFQTVKQTRDLVLGETVTGSISGKYGNNLAYPILDKEGRFKGTLTAQFNLDWLPGLLAKSEFPPTTAIVLTDTSRKVLWRYPELHRYIGQMLPDVLTRAMTSRAEGVAEGVGLPGDSRLFAFARLSPPWQEMWLLLGLPRDWAVGPVNRVLRRNLIWLGLVALLAMTAAWYGGDLFVVRPVRKLLGVTERLAAGDLGVRTGPVYMGGELGLLAHSFDRMADSLQEREESLRQSEERFRTLANAIPQLAWIAKSDGFIFWYNDRWYDYTGTTPEEMEGWGWQKVHDPEVLPQVLGQWQAAIDAGEPFDMVLPLRKADGQFRPFLTRVMPLKDASGKVIQWFGTNTDITSIKQAEEVLRRAHGELERRVAERTEELEETVAKLKEEVTERQRAEAALRESEERLRNLTSQLLTIQEVERGHLSRELHDDLGQALLFLRMQLNGILRRCSPEPELRQSLEEAGVYLLTVINKVRRLSQDLSPSTLEGLGLVEALRNLFEEFEKYYDHAMVIKADLDEVKDILPKEANIVIYRITQEFLANVHKHSEATQVAVAIKALPEKVTIALKDNGKGFDLEEVKSRPKEQRGLGVASMEERLRMLGSQFSMTSRPGKGTRLYFEIIRAPGQQLPGIQVL